jgi:hypothetical protein
MNLMAIILFALYPLSPMKRLWERARFVLQVILGNFEDPRFIDWLCANPDAPGGVAQVERCIDDLNSGLDLLIHARAREILGLPLGRWSRYRRSPPQRRRTRTFAELRFRLEACAIRFAEIERLAQRRAEKLAQLKQHAGSGGGPISRLTSPFAATAAPVPHRTVLASRAVPMSLPRSGEEGQRIRAPP